MFINKDEMIVAVCPLHSSKFFISVRQHNTNDGRECRDRCKYSQLLGQRDLRCRFAFLGVSFHWLVDSIEWLLCWHGCHCHTNKIRWDVPSRHSISFHIDRRHGAACIQNKRLCITHWMFLFWFYFGRLIRCVYVLYVYDYVLRLCVKRRYVLNAVFNRKTC